MFWLHLNDHWCFFWTFVDFILKKVITSGVKKSWPRASILPDIISPNLWTTSPQVNTVISWIWLADLNPCATCTMYKMYISLTTCIFLFRSGIAFYFHLFSTVQVTARPKKKNVCLQSDVKKNLGSVGINFFFSLSAKPEIVVPGSGIRYFIFEISGKPSFVEAVFMTSYVFLPSLLSISTKS